jgi:hypothetical protein
VKQTNQMGDSFVEIIFVLAFVGRFIFCARSPGRRNQQYQARESGIVFGGDQTIQSDRRLQFTDGLVFLK